MPRPQRAREIEKVPTSTWFKPAGVRMCDLEEVVLTFDEVEALRLADAEGLYQEAVAERMGVSRPTVGRILASARQKTADALVHGKAIRLEGGTIKLCSGATGAPGRGRGKGFRWRHGASTDSAMQTPEQEKEA